MSDTFPGDASQGLRQKEFTGSTSSASSRAVGLKPKCPLESLGDFFLKILKSELPESLSSLVWRWDPALLLCKRLQTNAMDGQRGDSLAS